MFLTIIRVPDIDILLQILAILSNICDVVEDIHTQIPIIGADLAPKKISFDWAPFPGSLYVPP